MRAAVLALVLVLVGTARLAQCCSPAVTYYPIAGPSNGGYDFDFASTTTLTCGAPGGVSANSDFIPGDHLGNDLFAERGTKAVAPVTGTIVKVGFTSVGGNRVTVRDSCGYWYYSAHLDTIAPGLQVGNTIQAGQLIGTVGNTGNAVNTYPHIHFSIYKDGVYSNGSEGGVG